MRPSCRPAAWCAAACRVARSTSRPSAHRHGRASPDRHPASGACLPAPRRKRSGPVRARRWQPCRNADRPAIRPASGDSRTGSGRFPPPIRSPRPPARVATAAAHSRAGPGTALPSPGSSWRCRLRWSRSATRASRAGRSGHRPAPRGICPDRFPDSAALPRHHTCRLPARSLRAWRGGWSCRSATSRTATPASRGPLAGSSRACHRPSTARSGQSPHRYRTRRTRQRWRQSRGNRARFHTRPFPPRGPPVHHRTVAGRPPAPISAARHRRN